MLNKVVIIHLSLLLEAYYWDYWYKHLIPILDAKGYIYLK